MPGAGLANAAGRVAPIEASQWSSSNVQGAVCCIGCTQCNHLSDLSAATPASSHLQSARSSAGSSLAVETSCCTQVSCMPGRSCPGAPAGGPPASCAPGGSARTTPAQTRPPPTPTHMPHAAVQKGEHVCTVSILHACHISSPCDAGLQAICMGAEQAVLQEAVHVEEVLHKAWCAWQSCPNVK